MSMWFGIKGTDNRQTGTAGTVTLPVGAYVLQIHANQGAGGGTVQIFGDPVTLPANSGWWGIQFNHALVLSTNASQTIVFTGTSSYLVEYVTPTS